MRNKVALVTGASSGIGVAFAHLLASKGYDLVLTARREDRLVVLAEALADRHGIVAKALVADLVDPGAPQVIYEKIKAWGMEIDLLVNNAGFGVYGKFSEIDDGQNFSMIQVMIEGLTELSRLFVRPMLDRGQGGILNVASIGADIPAPGLVVYAGVKAYVVHFTNSLNMELEGTGVTATVLLPGATRTEWLDVAGVKETKAIRRVSMSADAVALEGFRAHEKGKVKVIAGCMNKFQVCLIKKLPRCCVEKIMKYYMK